VLVDSDEGDRYGRIVGEVLLEGEVVCLERVQAGLVGYCKKYGGEETPDTDEHTPGPGRR
jgi:endonuclease YncB( thermonuclease family)